MTGTVVTDHRMIFSVSTTQTTLYDQIKFSGAAADFAWVLPIKGTVQVGISSDSLFEAIDKLTTTTIVAPTLPPCPGPPSCPYDHGGGGSSGSAGFSGSSGAGSSSGGAAPPPVTVLSQSTVGPYDQVQLQSTDPTALNNWLTAHGYVIPANAQSIITAYVSDGFDFLAVRLAPGSGVNAMVPISVTTPGAGLTLPLRMVSAGTGSTVGLTLWVLGSGRYEPMNFPHFTIDPATLTWDFATYQSDYATTRASLEAQNKNATWQVESSMDVSPSQVEGVVLYGSPYYAYYGSSSGSLAPTVDAGTEYAPLYGDGGPEAGVVTETADQVRTKDLATCFPGGNPPVRITRMRADLSQAGLATDLVLQAATNQSEISSTYQVSKYVNAPVCTPYPPLDCSTSSGSTPAPAYPFGAALGGGGSGNPPITINRNSPTGEKGAGCSASARDADPSWLEAGVGLLLGSSIWRRRRRSPGRR
jgi:hypothetical protein